MIGTRIIFIDYSKIKVNHYTAGVSSHDQTSIWFTDTMGTPIFNGCASKGNDLFWRKLYMHAGIQLECPGTIIYINKFSPAFQ